MLVIITIFLEFVKGNCDSIIISCFSFDLCLSAAIGGIYVIQSPLSMKH